MVGGGFVPLPTTTKEKDMDLRKWMRRHATVMNAASLGEIAYDAVIADPSRAAKVARCKDLLPALPGRVVDAVVRAFYALTVDFPYSKEHHHCEEFGVFDHGLASAAFALEGVPENEFLLKPESLTVIWWTALCMGVGRIQYIDVRAGEVEWNREAEPLIAFYARHGAANCTWTWQKGRPFFTDRENRTKYLNLLVPFVAHHVPRAEAEIVEEFGPRLREWRWAQTGRGQSIDAWFTRGRRWSRAG